MTPDTPGRRSHSACVTPESIKDVAYVVFYEKTLLKFDRLLETYLALAPNCWSSFSHAIPLWLHEKLFIKRKILRELGREFSGKIVFPSHHESHAASALFSVAV